MLIQDDCANKKHLVRPKRNDGKPSPYSFAESSAKAHGEGLG